MYFELNKEYKIKIYAIFNDQLDSTIIWSYDLDHNPMILVIFNLT